MRLLTNPVALALQRSAKLLPHERKALSGICDRAFADLRAGQSPADAWATLAAQ